MQELDQILAEGNSSMYVMGAMVRAFDAAAEFMDQTRASKILLQFIDKVRGAQASFSDQNEHFRLCAKAVGWAARSLGGRLHLIDDSIALLHAHAESLRSRFGRVSQEHADGLKLLADHLDYIRSDVQDMKNDDGGSSWHGIDSDGDGDGADDTAAGVGELFRLQRHDRHQHQLRGAEPNLRRSKGKECNVNRETLLEHHRILLEVQVALGGPQSQAARDALYCFAQAMLAENMPDAAFDAMAEHLGTIAADVGQGHAAYTDTLKALVMTVADSRKLLPRALHVL